MLANFLGVLPILTPSLWAHNDIFKEIMSMLNERNKRERMTWETQEGIVLIKETKIWLEKKATTGQHLES
jgi:hypothetical protein